MTARALSVDLHGTLLHLREPVVDVYLRIARRHGVRREPQATSDRLASAMRRHRGPWTADGRAMWRAVVFDALDSDDEALFEDLYLHYADPATWAVDTDLRNIIDWCRQQGWATMVLSNLDQRAYRLVEDLGLASRFDFQVLAHEAECPKPQRAIFELAAARLGGARPLHLGDHPREDIAGALAAGWAACLYLGAQDLDTVRQKVGMPSSE